MFIFYCEGDKFTIPEENVRLFAMSQAIDNRTPRMFRTNKEAINYLQTLGMFFYEIHN